MRSGHHIVHGKRDRNAVAYSGQLPDDIGQFAAFVHKLLRLVNQKVQSAGCQLAVEHGDPVGFALFRRHMGRAVCSAEARGNRDTQDFIAQGQLLLEGA